MSRVPDENTPFLVDNSEDAHITPYTRDVHRVPEENSLFLHNEHDHDEQDIVSYVQHRRASIASVGTENIPHNFNLSRSSSRNFDSERGERGDRLTLTPFKSHASSIDVQDVLSNSNLLAEPETSFKTEINVLIKYSVPLVITFLLQYSLTVASVFSVGRLGSNELAAVSLSSMTANISGYAIIQGISTCLDTLCAQSYGKKDYNTVGLHFMRCNYLLMIFLVPMFILWFFFSKMVLISIIGSDQQELCILASKYLQVISFGLPGFIWFENGKHFLQSQGIFHASTYVLALCAPLNIVLNYILVWNKTIGLGFIGAPLSVVITNYLMFVLLYAYIFFVTGYQCWPKHGLISKIYFKNWNKMINLSIPGVLMVEAEWLAFEIITFIASQFGTNVLAAQSIISTTCVLLYQIPFAISIASSTRIAWFIGAASKKSAIIATNTAIFVAIIVGMVLFTFLIIFRKFLASLYTSDEEVIKLAAKVLIIGSINQVNDNIACICSGVLRGQGRQKIGGILNLFSYYCIALPIAFVLSFHYNLQLIGLWLGMFIALFTLTVLVLYYVITSNWEDIISECINDGIHDDLNIDSHSIVPSMSSSHML